MIGRGLALACCVWLAACAGAAPREESPPAQPAEAAVQEPSRHCEVDADCAVKNVGNCCGYFPACVHKDAATFPEQVKAECAREGRMAICGFAEIDACQCVENRCVAAPAAGAEVQ
ncbi:hypothetical protein [Pseudomarimonas salicorniae]|uniref:Secreted protein n=1 Tax=Pseudomarimonas salicorniae TaxID=2933270 RepID=A0ABT0GE74_9GAMM|nr:hypothetical protein [Lysobacter sp. CAU 1642]MCK7592856.1 hypothetical protein [Lysobacter sp. CAU 1642]